ncbi:DUF488 domain-containing protein [Acidithiobacillus sulfuriphilus]|uniref:DUF488 family protein n=2 Tax=Acidithiobacillus sulfuriphilus TaxID=1867749 RepID=A0A3M8RSW5_9PROT|nr:DUF488 family protein [Acidithiobacillus sulfuriphilus]RNF71196.1 DUF488 family protein [Acidithiobacillus sulfuriphilus]
MAVSIQIWRVYHKPRPAGYAVLVERLWPRGIRKAGLALDEWAKDLAPSTALRQWFGHEPERWEEFQRRYRLELAAAIPAARQLFSAAGGRPLILLYAAHDEAHNGALVLRGFLQDLQGAAASRD